MAKPKKGVMPPQLAKYWREHSGKSSPKRKSNPMAKDKRKGGGKGGQWLKTLWSALSCLAILTVTKVIIRRTQNPILLAYEDEVIVTAYGGYLSVKNHSFSPLVILGGLMVGSEFAANRINTLGQGQ